jgi:hypothetical protein
MVVEQMFGHLIYPNKRTPTGSYLFQRGDSNRVPITFQDDVKHLHGILFSENQNEWLDSKLERTISTVFLNI